MLPPKILWSIIALGLIGTLILEGVLWVVRVVG
jgi:hypothetical protein